ncbi:unnamed protein product (macronuclear) [Paramecium tetraurelia]|uniref:Uncharacterized protein n=1 Tax=Paramecium tetraurelia TaxID=5888 RepID=A0DFD5_PARTE|nr:uncharacterized protein GSPATT00016565001 [Paramecium tetraurelia]CAK81752.1 unnamed protein product [Paramecium tetraurelia]|eukprot:XP_001449149.1 hypothetical protein (macronuclear) [Paramecium tetraurelia strain d4-2]
MSSIPTLKKLLRFPVKEIIQYNISVIPSALATIFIIALFLFIYVSLGMDLLGYLKPQNYLEGFDLHFQKFTTAIAASSEQWWALSVHTSTRGFVGIYIKVIKIQQHELMDMEQIKLIFLRALEISLYEVEQGLMGHLFHDVLVSLIKLYVELNYGFSNQIGTLELK